MVQSPLNDDWQQAVALRVSPRARYVRLRIDRRGRIELVMPRGFDQRRVSAILESHRPWVEQTLRRMGPQIHQPLVPPGHIELLALGSHWQVDYQHRGRNGYREPTQGRLSLRQDGQWPVTLRRWLALQGKRHLVPWLRQVSEELGLPFAQVAVRGQKTRWGSCSAKGNINLNYALLFLPPEQVRYLFVHELCHTVHLNHSPAFWRLVASHCPDYRHHDRALRGAMAHLPAWLHD